MPNTKNYSTRLRVLDQCLRSGHAYSGKELTDFINREWSCVVSRPSPHAPR